MAKFNLTSTNTTAVTRLQPWTINEVVLKGVELKTGTSKEGNNWKAIQFKFAGNGGIFEPMIFCPKEDGGDVRPSGESNGRRWEMPSALEQLQFTIAHIVGTLVPSNFEKLQKISLELPAEFDKLVDTVKKALAPAFNKSTNIKLIGDNRGYAAIPNFININKDSGEAYISNNWIGDNLAFSAYEIKKMEAAKNAKPTEVSEAPADDIDSSDDNNDLDFDI